MAQCLVFGKNSVLLGVNNTVRLSQAGSSGGTGGRGCDVSIPPGPLTIPGPVREVLQPSCLCLQAVTLTQVRKSMCDQKNTAGLSPLLGNPHSQPTARLYFKSER